MSPEEPVEPTQPHTEEQRRWIERHKAPDLTLDQIISNVDPMTPQVIKEQIAEAAAQGGVVIDNDNGLAHAPGHGPTCSCSDCFAMNEHSCHCVECYSPVRPSLVPRSKHHYSNEFGDSVLQAAKFVNGEWLLIGNAVEVNVDEDYAICVSQPPHTCRNCWRGYCMYKDRGEFGVRLEKHEPGA